MPISQAIADQIANLLNSENQLAVLCTAADLLQHQGRYIIRLGENSKVLGAAEVKRVQWYHREIAHLSADPEAKRHGTGTWLLLGS